MGDLQAVRRAPARALRLGTARRRMLPGFLIVGAKRSGSTSLYEYVIRHPMVAPSMTKKGSHYFDENYDRGWRWFRSTFPLRHPGTRVTGEASPYYMFHPLAPDRIRDALPDVRLVAVLRDPVVRAYSHFQYETRRGFETLGIHAALDAEAARTAGEADRMRAESGYDSFTYRHQAYLARGRYAEQVERLHGLFGADRLLLVQSEAMFAEPNATLNRVWRFLGLPEHDLGPVIPHKAGSYDHMPADVQVRLAEYYAPHNERLYALPGVDFRWPAVPALFGSGGEQPTAAPRSSVDTNQERP